MCLHTHRDGHACRHPHKHSRMRAYAHNRRCTYSVAPISKPRVGWAAIKVRGFRKSSLAKTNFWPVMRKRSRAGLFSRLPGRVGARRAALVRKFRRSPPDIIISKSVATGSILEALTGLGRPIVSVIDELETLIQMFASEADKVFACADMFVAVSQAVKDNIVQSHGIAQEKVRVIHNFVEPVDVESYALGASAVRRKLDIPANAFVVGTCASLTYGKGVDFFIEAAARLYERQVYFMWIGANSSPYTRLQVLYEIKKRGLQDRVKLVGEQNDVYPYLAACDAFFLSSREDAFSLTMIEAAQCGLPVIGFRGTGGVEDFLAEGGGALAGYADIGDICKAICVLKDDEALYRETSRQSRVNFHTYSRDASEKKWLNLIGSRTC